MSLIGSQQEEAGKIRSHVSLEILLTCSWAECWEKPALVCSFLIPTSGPEEAGTNCGSLHSSKQVAQGYAQAASDISLQQSPSQEVSEPKHPVASFRPPSDQNPITFTSSILKVRSQQVPNPDELNYTLHVVSTYTAGHTLWSGLIFKFSRPKCLPST